LERLFRKWFGAGLPGDVRFTRFGNDSKLDRLRDDRDDGREVWRHFGLACSAFSIPGKNLSVLTQTTRWKLPVAIATRLLASLVVSSTCHSDDRTIPRVVAMS